MARAFDLAAYGYAGPKQPERPKPVPPATEPAPQPTLVISVADLLDKDTVARLRAAVAPPAEDTAPAPKPPATEVRGEHGPELVHFADAVPGSEAPTVAPEPVQPAEPDPWTAMVAHLTKDEPDAWSVLVSNLTTTASSSAATEA